MKIDEILKFNKTIKEAFPSEHSFSDVACDKLREIVELMPDIIRTVKLSSYHTDYDLEAKLNNWLED